MPSEKQYQERKENISAIVQFLRLHGKQTRRQIAGALHLSWGCVSELVWILISQNILQEEAGNTSAKGRTPGLLTLNPDITFLGIVVEKTGLKASVCNLAGQETATYADKLDYTSKDALIRCVCDFTHSILDRHPQLRGIGFAMQGIQAQPNGAWEFPASPRFYLDFETELQPNFPLPSIVEHDTNCVLYGALNNTQERKMILHLSHGIGAALYTQNGFSKSDLMEFGYLAVNSQGLTMQQVASLDALRQACGGTEDVSKAQVQGFFTDMGAYLGTALGNLCNLIHLDEILLCGDMLRYSPLFRPALMESYGKTVLSAARATITEIPVGNAAFGAARLAMDSLLY